jgi:serine/threonine protein kinase
MQEVTPIADNWRRLEGAKVDGRYQLLNCFSATEEEARFAAEADGRGAVTVLLAGPAARYEAVGLEHPNLLRVFDIGRAEFEGEQLPYAATEVVEESLADVLAERALTPEETREVLGEALNALGWLHAHGIAHGGVCPRNIVAVGNTVKLNGAVLRSEAGRPATPYDPPEGGASASGDVWSLATTMFEALTRRLPSEAADLNALAEPFQRIAENTLITSPSERWGVDRISAYMSGGDIDAPLTDRDEREALAAPLSAPARREASRKWGYAALAVAAASVIAVALWPAGDGGVPPRPGAAAPASAQPPISAQLPSPVPTETPVTEPPSQAKRAAEPPPAAAREERQFWRVIVYTFAQRQHAEQRADAINRRFPEFEAEVFTPNDSGPYLVAIGGRMSRQEATQLRAKARASGLPSDAYAQNYSR